MNHASAEPRAPVHRSKRRLALRCAVAVAALLGITTVLIAARAALGDPQAPVPTPAPRLQSDLEPEDPITGLFQRRALNALLVPLLDDDQPPRWTDVPMRFFCGPATRVEIDGLPFVPGSSVPATAFTVRWHIDQCWPLDYASFELSGVVDLVVYHEDTGLSAIVSAQRLRIATAKGTASLEAPFAASMSIGDVSRGP